MASKNIDWEAIEREYRAGLLSLREIARQQHVSPEGIRKRAQKFNWKKNLSEKVKQEIAAKLTSVDAVNAQKDQEIIEAAATKATEVILCHRKDARQQSFVVNHLMTEVQRRIEGKQVEGLPLDDIRITFAMLRDSSQALLKLTQIERQAYSLDSGLNSGVTSVLSPDKVSKPDNAGVSD